MVTRSCRHWLSSRAETREGELYDVLPDGRLRCYACGHCCPLPDGAVGVCKVRFNEGGRLRVPWGYVGGVQCDPIEKKPFFHAYPGALAYSFGMLGCDLHCGYCQNWVTSQALRDPAAVAPPLDGVARSARPRRAAPRRARHRQHLQRAADHQRVGGRGLQGSQGRRASSTGYVSNGNGTPRGARVPAAVGRSLQGRSQELRRSPLPPARRPPRSRSSTRSAGCTRWASGSRSSRC